MLPLSLMGPLLQRSHAIDEHHPSTLESLLESCQELVEVHVSSLLKFSASGERRSLIQTTSVVGFRLTDEHNISML